MFPRSIAFPVTLLALSLMAVANPSGGKVCTPEEAGKAETEMDHLGDWGSVHRSYARFSHCDDGSIAEGYSDAVGKLLADHWGQFGHLYQLVSGDKAFASFVIRHIDETIPSDTRQKVLKNAHSQCPVGRQEFCEQIARAASDK